MCMWIWIPVTLSRLQLISYWRGGARTLTTPVDSLVAGFNLEAYQRWRMAAVPRTSSVAYCYRQSSVVCWSDCRSVCYTSEPCKNVLSDQSAVWVEDSGEPREQRIRWGSRSPHGKGQFWGEKQRPIVKYRDSVVICAKLAEPFEVLFWLWARMGPRNHVLDGVQILHAEGQLLGGRACPGMPNNTLSWAVQKWLNQSICHLGCQFGWPKGSTSSIVFTRWHQCALMEGHIGASLRIRLNHLSAVAMWPYVKLLWPVVTF